MPNFENQTVRFAPGSSPYKPTHNPSGTKLLIFDGDKAILIVQLSIYSIFNKLLIYCLNDYDIILVRNNHRRHSE